MQDADAPSIIKRVYLLARSFSTCHKNVLSNCSHRCIVPISKCYGEEITTPPQYILQISAICPLSQVRWRSNYVPPQYIIHISLPQILCRRCEGGVITDLDSIYSKFLIYLLCRRCDGEVIMYHHSIYSIYLHRRYSVEGARAELLRTSIVYTPYF